jgi:endonuclease/exonuclease/phosphatase (EEP) superfamily protein YafD
LKLTAAHFNLSNAASPAELSKSVLASSADLLSLHEVTPGWTGWLQDSVALAYPHHHTMVDLGIFGMALYSKHPFTSIDTFYYNEVPNLRACIEKDGTGICFLSVHTEPALNEPSMRRLVEHLDAVTAEVGSMDAPLLVLGDFNSVSWSQELQHFMSQAGLLESRSGFMDIQKSFRNVPVDHIFYSRAFNCADFDALTNGSGRHLGIRAKFRLKPNAYHVKKTAQ